MKRLIVLLFISEAFILNAQKDTIWLLNGESLVASNIYINEDGILTYKNKRNKSKLIDLEYVFSIVDSNNQEKLFFEPNTIENTYFTIEQMRSFIKGENAAIKDFHSPMSTVSGIVTGAGSIYLLPSVLHLNVFFSPIIPAVNSLIVGSFNYKEKKIKKKYPDKADDMYFIAGYRGVAMHKRTNNSIKGGIIGLGLGITSLILLHNMAK